MRSKVRSHKKYLSARIPNILIIVGILIIIMPFATEAYGYFESVQLVNEWNTQAQVQRVKAQQISAKQDRLVSSGQLPHEDSVIGSARQEQLGDKQEEDTNKPFPKTKIMIPKIGVNQVVLEGVGPEILKFGPGHYIGMTNPGQKGNCGIAGHRVTYTHPFNRLDELDQGDSIFLETVDYIYEYQVTKMQVTNPSDVRNLQKTLDATVTLTTCNPKYSARTRLNIMGILVNSKPRQVNFVRIVKAIFKTEEKPVHRVDRPKTYAEIMADLNRAKHAVAKNPMDGAAHLLWAQSEFALARYIEAYEELRKAALIIPTSADVQDLYTKLEIKKSELTTAIIYNEGAIATGRADPAPFFDLGNLYLASGDYAKAAEIFQRGIDAYPYAADMYVLEGQALEKAGDLPAAFEAYKSALDYDPTYADAINGMKRIQSHQKALNVVDVQQLPYDKRPQ